MNQTLGFVCLFYSLADDENYKEGQFFTKLAISVGQFYMKIL